MLAPRFHILPHSEMPMTTNVTRRAFLKTAAPAAASTALMPGTIDVSDFQAVGDGKTDNTAAIQRALEKAAETKATVYLPAGVFCCSTLKVPPHIGLCGDPVWDYGTHAGSVIRLNSASANCLLDVTGAFGVRINGICLDGVRLGRGIHGVLLDKPDYGRHEDAVFIAPSRATGLNGMRAAGLFSRAAITITSPATTLIALADRPSP